MDQNTLKKETTRRDFGKGALWVAPALTVLIAASSKPAFATVGYPCEKTYEPV
jgi:hypothetical protein